MTQVVGEGEGEGDGDAVSAVLVGDDDGAAGSVTVGPAPVVAARPHPATISAIAPMTTNRSAFMARDVTQGARH